ncbi:LysE family transporter [Lacrimispora sp. AGF001]|uniref:LysE family transporter n=1 Tax=Lacrimispora sp. AGF001 TaxID=3401631 RepID=UPI003B42A4E4
MANLLQLLSYVFVSNISPGPNAIISMSNARKFGFKKSILFNLGISTGAFIVLLGSSLFSWIIFDIFPAFQLIMVWVGAAYILWLAWVTLQSKPAGENKYNKDSGNLFLQGVVLQFVNPNTILYGITAFSSFILPQYQSPLILILFCILLSFASFFCTLCWTVFGAVFQMFIVKHTKIVNIVLAVLLAYCAVTLVIKTL